MGEIKINKQFIALILIALILFSACSNISSAEIQTRSEAPATVVTPETPAKNIPADNTEPITQHQEVSGEPEGDALYVRLTFDDGEALVRLDDNVAAKSWYAMLPMTHTFEEFRSWHKIIRIPDKISVEGMEIGNDPDIGDISLHIPWNALVFYHDEYDGNDSSVHIGWVESGLDLIAAMRGEVTVTMTPVTDSVEEINIIMTVGDKIITAALDNSATTREFLQTLPRTMAMTEWGSREYYGRLDAPLSEDGERIANCKNGDVTYYPPGPSFAIFYAKDDTASQGGLIRMGSITSELSVFDTFDNTVEMLIEIAP